VIVSPLPGTTRDSVDVEIRHKNKTFILVDNAGIRKLQKVKDSTESAAVIRAERGLKDVDVLIFVVDISKKIDQNDLFIAQKIQKSARPVIIAGNKWDLVEEKGLGLSLAKKIENKFNFLYYAKFIATSAVTGKNIFHLMERVEIIWNRLTTPIKTPALNRIVSQILSEKRLMTEKNRIFNPKYVSVESYRPLFFRFQSSSGQRLKPFFEMYLKRRLIDMLDLSGIPVFFNIVAKKTRRLKK
jgi:GTP-binding protein